ncbi:glycoside hydrolase family protein [Novipirellula artificiosorum]|uniref:hypothetical protein n=1 Tax=Novipirellula artificiosorum TaxID=2528016 RepID=UPI0018CE705A|nr:hypothetical protein [Novipirellula artificiosorum]
MNSFTAQGMVFKSDHVQAQWDTWAYEYEGTFYLYYLITEHGPGEGFGVATSTDGVHWEDHGWAIRQSSPIGAYRPRFHFSAQEGYINDPNGLFFYNGVYPMFFQHWDMGRKAWGHATSENLLHWSEQGDALRPRDGFQAFSGGAVIDKHNTSGLQDGEPPPIVALFTAWGDGQHLANSTDGGWNWNRNAFRRNVPKPIVGQAVLGSAISPRLDPIRQVQPTQALKNGLNFDAFEFSSSA